MAAPYRFWRASIGRTRSAAGERSFQKQLWGIIKEHHAPAERPALILKSSEGKRLTHLLTDKLAA